MDHVIIGVDPHKLSATIEVVDQQAQLLGSGRFTTDQAGYKAMRTYAKTWPDRVWAVEGANGIGRPLAQRLLEAGEQVVDVPAKLAARIRLFDTGHNRKTDARDAHSIAIVAVRTKTLRVLQVDGELEALRMLTDRREALTRRRAQTVDRLQALLAELLPGQAKRDITTGQAKAILASVRPRDVAGKTRRRIAAVTQLRLDTDGRTYYRRKRAEGKKSLEALRCLKRRISDVIYRQLIADAEHAAGTGSEAGPGGHCGASQESCAADLPPHIGTSDQPLPGPAHPTLRPASTSRKTRRDKDLAATG